MKCEMKKVIANREVINMQITIDLNTQIIKGKCKARDFQEGKIREVLIGE